MNRDSPSCIFRILESVLSPWRLLASKLRLAGQGKHMYFASLNLHINFALTHGSISCAFVNYEPCMLIRRISVPQMQWLALLKLAWVAV